jgi:hypothetical protein
LLNEQSVKQIAHTAKLSKTECLLLCLAAGDDFKEVATIRAIAVNAGIKGAKNWNISQLLSASSGAIKTPRGWELAPDGRQTVKELAGPLLSSVTPKAASSLRSHLTSLSDADTRVFVEEAIACLENRLLRAAVVLSWVGATSVLYNAVLAHHLPAFNAEATRRDAKWKNAKNTDELGRMKEHDFLQVLEAISVIGKNVKTELEACLKFRNGCGHPNSLQIGEQRVTAHIETLTLNVFSRF